MVQFGRIAILLTINLVMVIFLKIEHWFYYRCFIFLPLCPIAILMQVLAVILLSVNAAWRVLFVVDSLGLSIGTLTIVNSIVALVCYFIAPSSIYRLLVSSIASSFHLICFNWPRTFVSNVTFAVVDWTHNTIQYLFSQLNQLLC